MKLSFARLTALALFGAFCACSAAARAAEASGQGADEAAVRGLMTAFGEAFAKLDAHAFSLIFHEDADFTNVFGMSAHGRKAIEEFHRPLLEGDGAGSIPSFKHAEFKVVETKAHGRNLDADRGGAEWEGYGAAAGSAHVGRDEGEGRLGDRGDAQYGFAGETVSEHSRGRGSASWPK